MNQILFDFYSGNKPNIENHTFIQILDMSDKELESSHFCIQWLFPLQEPSMFNLKAPLLDEETISAMKDSSKCMANLELAHHRWMSFLFGGVNSFLPFWFRPKNHNHLRITRMLRCYRLLGRNDLAQELYELLMHKCTEFPDIINSTTLEFWQNAMLE